jgi:transposase
MYSLALSMFLAEQKINYYVVSGLLVKRSLGLVRGKNDQLDAKNLSRFASLYHTELQPYQLPSANILKLKQLLTYRDKLIRQRTAHKSFLTEAQKVLNTKAQIVVITSTKQLIKTLTEHIKEVEKEMVAAIESDQDLLANYKLITTIKGVGLILSVAILVSTNNFKSFKCWRKFACYAGIAPFEHRSGSSIRGKTRVSSLGNRELKTLLNQAACTAIQYNTEMKLYYERRINLGKSKMSTINVVRNKLVSRIFAIVKRQSPLVDLHKFAA